MKQNHKPRGDDELNVTGTLNYPATRTEDGRELLAGVSFADPYSWLEHDSEEVLAWQRAQARLASEHVAEWPHVEQLREWVAKFRTERPERYGGLPRHAAGKWFRTRIAEGASQAQALIADEPMGEGRVLFDPLAEHSLRPPFLSWIAPSPDGCTLAVGICRDGSEKNSIRLIDVTTGTVLPDPPRQTLMDNWTGGVHWLPDSSGFFFSALAGDTADFEQRVYLHRRHPHPHTEPVDVPWVGKKEYRLVTVSADGRHAVALERLYNPIPVAIAPLTAGPLQWRPFVTQTTGTVAGHVIGERYIAVTDVGASRGRLVSIALNADDPNDSESWQELIPQSEAVLRIVTPVDGHLFLTELVDTYTRVRIVGLDGSHVGYVPLPARGAVSEQPFPLMNLLPKGHPERYIFAFSSLISGPGIYSYQLGQDSVVTLQPPQVQIENAVIEDHWAVSADGTRIPYHLVRRTDLHLAGPQPTMIYAYGGFNIALVPQFPGSFAAFVAMGGVFVHANLRGGGEFGRDWWQQGRMRNKHRCYEDLYAVAEHLIASGRCAPQLLAVTGGSNGGLMAAVAATQRPDLWKVVVPRVPLLDLIGACRDSYDRMCIASEYADVNDPDDVRRLAGFSPYHLIKDGVDYPAVYLDAGATDPRCPPWHARKFAARMQAATAGSAPVVLHVWENVGHGGATDRNVAIDELTEWLAFVLRHLGVDVKKDRRAPYGG